MKSIAAIREEIEHYEGMDYRQYILEYQDDPRSGVQKLVEGLKKKEKALQEEIRRTESLKQYEHLYEQLGYVCGIDEVGRGPLAGPVVACAVILPRDTDILYLDDSKKLSPGKREMLCERIREKAVAIGLGQVEAERIDQINILNATYEAMRQAIRNLSVRPAVLLNDAVTIPEVDIPQIPIIKGDQKSVSIAAASIVAKVTRDRLMTEYDQIMPEYGFAQNKGYGSRMHIEALERYGPSPIHRRSFIGNFSLPDTEDGPTAAARENKRTVGSLYEEQAAEYLEKNGLRILERNFRSHAGEIDLIARDGEYLVFVEVKYRRDSTQGEALEAITPAKQKTILKVAGAYLTLHHMSLQTPCRFDAVGINGDQLVWVRDAFQA